jgi:hypothetical protein
MSQEFLKRFAAPGSPLHWQLGSRSIWRRRSSSTRR